MSENITSTIENVLRKHPVLNWTFRVLQFVKNVHPKYYFKPSVMKLLWTARSRSQVNYKGLVNVYELASDVEKNNIRGAAVECGVWRGGASSVMASALKNAKRKVYLFDSFEGMPEASQKDTADAVDLSNNRFGGKLEAVGTNIADIEDVKSYLFDTLKLDANKVALVKGWFQETLPQVKNTIGDIALLRLDGDWYESTKVCLDELYDQVVSGGYIIIDDYYWFEGCQKAVDEFLAQRNITVDLIHVEKGIVYFVKP